MQVVGRVTIQQHCANIPHRSHGHAPTVPIDNSNSQRHASYIPKPGIACSECLIDRTLKAGADTTYGDLGGIRCFRPMHQAIGYGHDDARGRAPPAATITAIALSGAGSRRTANL